jgi:biopolymer transport protein TolR
VAARNAVPRGEINITPLVDVVLVLLIIFMVVTPLMTKKIQVQVPDDVVEGPPQPQVVVSVSTDGQLAINTHAVTDGEYVAELAKVLDVVPSGERLVFFTADPDANYARLVLALDGARRAGADTLGMATEKLAVAR